MLRLALSDDLSDDARAINPFQLQARMEAIAQVVNGGIDTGNLAAGLLFSLGNPGGGVVPNAVRNHRSPLCFTQMKDLWVPSDHAPPPCLPFAYVLQHMDVIWLPQSENADPPTCAILAQAISGASMAWTTARTLVDNATMATLWSRKTRLDRGMRNLFGGTWEIHYDFPAPVAMNAGERVYLSETGAFASAFLVASFRLDVDHQV